MMRWIGSGAVRWSLIGCIALLLGGCTQSVVVSEEAPVSTASSPVQPEGSQPALTETADNPEAADAPAAPAAAVAAAAVKGVPLEIREVKLIEDNGQQGLFVKLSDKPVAVTHYTASKPERLVVDIAGSSGAEAISAQKYAVTNPVVGGLRVSRTEGKIRLTIDVKGDKIPGYTVSDLNDTVVIFLGEHTGGTEPAREQMVFSRRAGVAPLVTTGGEIAVAPRDVGAAQPPNQQLGAGRAGLRAAYSGQHVSLDFKDADVHNVLRLLAEVSKLNIVATDDVRGKVTLRLFDVPWDQALDIILQTLNLESEQEGNVIRISTVRRLREEREELVKAQDAAKVLEPVHIDYITVNYAKAAKLAEIISGAARSRAASQVSGRGASAEEGVLTNRGSVFVDEFSNTIIVRDTQRGIDNARELVRRLDVQIPQVLIESSIVEATTDFARDLGVQWGYRYLAGPNTGNPTGVNFPGRIGLGGSGLGGASTGLPFIADFPAAVAPGAGSALDLALGSIDGSQSLDVRLTAFERTGRAKVISRPRVVTLNNVAATIKSLTIIRVKLPSTGTIINTGAGGAAGTASAATERIETGIVLIVTPQVSSDGFVLLDMSAKSSQADFARTVDNIPTEISREANSHVLIKNGQTVVLGGIYRDNISDTVTGLPFLKDIPAIGWMFRENSKIKRREDLLVFLTPRIMGAPSANLPSAEQLWRERDAGRED